MNLLYLSVSYIPSRRASSLQVMKMCAAMARLGHRVELVAKRAAERNERAVGDDFAFYGVEPGFTLTKLRRPQRRGGSAVYLAEVARLLLARRRTIDLVYSRDILAAALALTLRLPVVFEAHGLPMGRLQYAAWRRLIASPRLAGMVVISDGLRRDLAAEGLLPAHGTIIAHDAADAPRATSAARPRNPRQRIGYVGNLYRGRGVETILELARRMPDCQFDLIGGTQDDLARWRDTGLPGNVILHGFHPPSRLGEFYDQLDVVLMPHSKDGVLGAAGVRDISRWTSPMKMFEYMASGVPLVASDLPVLREVLRDGENALLVAPGDVAGWERAIRKVLGDDALRGHLAGAARDDLVRHYTWDARARHVLASLGAPA